MESQALSSGPSRRQHDRAFKSELVRQSLEPGASVAAIALRNGVNANLLFKWRREHLRAGRATVPAAVLLPVCVTPATEVAATSTAIAPTPTALTNQGHTSIIELELAGARLCLRGAIDEAVLGSVLRALRRSA